MTKYEMEFDSIIRNIVNQRLLEEIRSLELQIYANNLDGNNVCIMTTLKYKGAVISTSGCNLQLNPKS